ncbi:MAG TPA: SidA/IucD/PvdA family monooxygenase [Rugosimonospora sp.]|nr:SidA/IucD/PvdA family monooxygenase [Rugosimonospora sp.]
MTIRAGDPHQHFACVGVGIGPANLSLASLLAGRPEITNVFFERRNRFSWHDGQLFPGTSLQVSMLKDLVSLADPTSGYSFVAYLHDQGRLYHYLHAKFEAVPREEFRNYFEWACRRNANLRFDEGVESIDFDGEFVVRTSRRTVTADNVVIGVGGEPWVPPSTRPHLGESQFHVNQFLERPRDLGGRRVAVVGGGQSGAEAVLELISRPAGERPRRTMWVSRRLNYFPIDDSSFTNDYFTPAFSDHFSRLDPAERANLNTVNVLTSDGVSRRTLKAIYQRIYVCRFIQGEVDAVALYPARNVVRVTPARTGGWELAMVHRVAGDAVEHIEADVVIWATGMRPARLDFLGPIAGRLAREGTEYRINEHFEVLWDGPPGRRVFIQNAARQQRGLADGALSLLAWRSQRIADRMRGVYTDRQVSSFIEWSAKASSFVENVPCVENVPEADVPEL